MQATRGLCRRCPRDWRDEEAKKRASDEFKVVALLLERRADVNLKDANGDTAADFAKSDGHAEIVTMLRAAGAPAMSGKDFVEAATAGKLDAVRAALERGVDIEHDHRRDGRALMAAARGGHKAVVTLLLERGAQVDIELDKRGKWTDRH
eukprot:6314916-Prymnesium_polylepis.1